MDWSDMESSSPMLVLALHICLLILCAAFARRKRTPVRWLAIAGLLCAAVASSLYPEASTQSLRDVAATWLGVSGLAVGLGFGSTLVRERDLKGQLGSLLPVLAVLPVALLVIVTAAGVRSTSGIGSVMPLVFFLAAGAALLATSALPTQKRATAQAGALVLLLAAGLAQRGGDWLTPTVAVGVGAAWGMASCLMPSTRSWARVVTLGSTLIFIVGVCAASGLPSLWLSFGVGLSLGLFSKARKRFMWTLERLPPASICAPLLLFAAFSPPPAWSAGPICAVLAFVWLTGRQAKAASEAPADLLTLALVTSAVWTSLATWRPGLGSEIAAAATGAAASAPALVLDVHSAVFFTAVAVSALCLSRRGSRASAEP